MSEAKREDILFDQGRIKRRRPRRIFATHLVFTSPLLPRPSVCTLLHLGKLGVRGFGPSAIETKKASGQSVSRGLLPVTADGAWCSIISARKLANTRNTSLSTPPPPSPFLLTPLPLLPSQLMHTNTVEAGRLRGICCCWSGIVVISWRARSLLTGVSSPEVAVNCYCLLPECNLGRDNHNLMRLWLLWR